MTFFLNLLEKAQVIYLSTSKNNKVSVRPVSPINHNFTIFIRTSELSAKVDQIKNNPHVAGVCDDFQFEGTAKIIGKVDSTENRMLKKEYKTKYPDAFSTEDRFLTDEDIFIEIDISLLKVWKPDAEGKLEFIEVQF
ncbi:pyridoxamine 5'-phosphate oxidase family protein [Listeria sp. PSOL-1]|uniref:pyridoxamine 5'-phosphate oxidase family protein n=1 Tax=Listeria sp. PSOL-1 TaxID=1844999 RepID=UPI001E41E655|nr:pyridoxamine 5'-phosphate oxidase family protein [Listeria sp. PSOL-1]